jgi:hypothetical protein
MTAISDAAGLTGRFGDVNACSATSQLKSCAPAFAPRSPYVTATGTAKTPRLPEM